MRVTTTDKCFEWFYGAHGNVGVLGVLYGSDGHCKDPHHPSYFEGFLEFHNLQAPFCGVFKVLRAMFNPGY